MSPFSFHGRRRVCQARNRQILRLSPQNDSCSGGLQDHFKDVLLDRHDVVARVHGDDRAGDSAGETAAEEKGRLGDFIHRDIPL